MLKNCIHFPKYSQSYAEFTELEVVHLWNTFQIDFPEDTINKLQMTELVRRIFPRSRWIVQFWRCWIHRAMVYWRHFFRCNAEVVIGNLFKVKHSKERIQWTKSFKETALHIRQTLNIKFVPGVWSRQLWLCSAHRAAGGLLHVHEGLCDWQVEVLCRSLSFSMGGWL